MGGPIPGREYRDMKRKDYRSGSRFEAGGERQLAEREEHEVIDEAGVKTSR